MFREKMTIFKNTISLVVGSDCQINELVTAYGFPLVSLQNKPDFYRY